MKNRTLKSRRFTLVEIITVLAVIAILFLLLLPAFSRARKMTYRTMCANNMRNFGDFSTLYAQEYKHFITSYEGRRSCYGLWNTDVDNAHYGAPIVTWTVMMYPEFSDKFTTVSREEGDVIYWHKTGAVNGEATGNREGNSGWMTKVLYDIPGSPFKMFACEQPSKFDVPYDKDDAPLGRYWEVAQNGKNYAYHGYQGVSWKSGLRDVLTGEAAPEYSTKIHTYQKVNGESVPNIAINRDYAFVREKGASSLSSGYPAQKANVYEAHREPNWGACAPVGCKSGGSASGGVTSKAIYEDQYRGRHVDTWDSNKTEGPESNVLFFDGHVEIMHAKELKAHYKAASWANYYIKSDDDYNGDTLVDGRMNIFTPPK